MENVDAVLDELKKICSEARPGPKNASKAVKSPAASEEREVSPQYLVGMAIHNLETALDALKEARDRLAGEPGRGLHIVDETEGGQVTPQDMLPPEPAALEAARAKAIQRIRDSGAGSVVDDEDESIPFVGQDLVRPGQKEEEEKTIGTLGSMPVATTEKGVA